MPAATGVLMGRCRVDQLVKQPEEDETVDRSSAVDALARAIEESAERGRCSWRRPVRG